ncbi:MAG: putative O-glycosylation ligase, exosortase A system-associated [Comamonadaceae bacterium]|nr:putative O-glycosylation ligase, exosortase A system-associated [Comamonadaceae bacterium]
MRDLLFALAMLALIPLAFVRPFNAYMLWGWTSAMIPTGFLFGFMASARVNFIFAGITLLLVVLRRVDWSQYRFNWAVVLYLVFLLHATVSWLTGYAGNDNNFKYFDLLMKGLVFSMLMPMFVQTRMHFHAILLVVVFGLGLHGVIEGLKTVVSGGSHNMFGPAGSMLYDRNHLSTALAMVLPIAYYLYLHSVHRFARWGFLSVFVLIVLAIMGGGSRGGFVALAVVAFWLILTSRHRWRTLFIVLAMGLLLSQFVPDSVVARLETIGEAKEDDSFMGRVHAWKISSALALEHPFFGGGFHAVQVQYVWDHFKTAPSLLDFLNLPEPEFVRAKAAHSVYFEVMGDLGFLGLFLYLLIFSLPLLSRFSVKRMATRLGPDYVWARDLGDMLMLAVMAYLVGGASVSVAYLEMAYFMVMLMAVLQVHLRQRLNEHQREQARLARAAPDRGVA